MDKSVLDSRMKFGSAEDDSQVQSEIYRDCVFCESAGDFDLPDYLPEIRKLVRVSSRIIPAGRFIGGDRADFGGSVAHTVVYTDPDGTLCATSITSDYEIGVAIPKNEGRSVSAVSDSSVESVTCRLIGPRRLSIRTRIRNQVRMECDLLLPCRPSAPEGSALELLEAEESAMRFCSAQSGEITLTDTHRLDGSNPDAVKVIFCSAEVHIEDTSSLRDGVRCRGTAWCRATVSDGGTPFSVTKRIPFEESIPCDADEGYHAVAHGTCSSMQVTPVSSVGGGCELAFDVTVELSATAVADLPFRSIADAFIPGMSTVCHRGQFSPRKLCGAAIGNFSISGSSTREGDAAQAASVIDTDGRIKSVRVIAERGRAVVTGECAVSALLALPPSSSEGRVGFSSFEYDLPFRCELDTHSRIDDDCIFDCRVGFLGAKSRIDGASLATDAEICVSLIAHKSRPLCYLTSIEGSDETVGEHSNGRITVYYPTDSDSLWSVAKKYGVSRASLAASNDLSEVSLRSSALPHSIDGISCLIIE